jgi:hypothetical protein
MILSFMRLCITVKYAAFSIMALNTVMQGITSKSIILNVVVLRCHLAGKY